MSEPHILSTIISLYLIKLRWFCSVIFFSRHWWICVALKRSKVCRQSLSSWFLNLYFVHQWVWLLVTRRIDLSPFWSNKLNWIAIFFTCWFCTLNAYCYWVSADYKTGVKVHVVKKIKILIKVNSTKFYKYQVNYCYCYYYYYYGVFCQIPHDGC